MRAKSRTKSVHAKEMKKRADKNVKQLSEMASANGFRLGDIRQIEGTHWIELLADTATGRIVCVGQIPLTLAEAQGKLRGQ